MICIPNTFRILTEMGGDLMLSILVSKELCLLVLLCGFLMDVWSSDMIIVMQQRNNVSKMVNQPNNLSSGITSLNGQYHTI